MVCSSFSGCEDLRGWGFGLEIFLEGCGGWMDGWMSWMDGWMDGWMDELVGVLGVWVGWG